MIRQCVICGAEFNASPSDNKVTCGDPVCRSERARRARTGHGVPWNEESRKKLAERGRPPALEKGAEAARRSPIAGPYETNRNALVWRLRAPDGTEHIVRNLTLWLRDHADILDGTPEQARAGIMQIKRSMLGKTKRPVGSWKGWQLISWKEPE